MQTILLILLLAPILANAESNQSESDARQKHAAYLACATKCADTLVQKEEHDCFNDALFTDQKFCVAHAKHKYRECKEQCK